jgi:Zn-dependent protease with chaperone function
MFYSLCIALCLAVMFMVCTAAMVLSLPAIRLGRLALQTARPQTRAGFWFLLRMAPFALAAMVSLGLALPSFLKFEPHSTGEMVDWHLLALAALGAALLVVIIGRIMRLLRSTRALERTWILRSRKLCLAGVPFPVYSVRDTSSLLAVTGIVRPRVFISCDVAEALTTEELSAALKHELAHVSRMDNLKQLLLKSTQLPLQALRGADAEWTNASEIAADETAVTCGASPLELSSALIKVGRLSGRMLVPPRFAASHLVPCGCGASTGMRAAHLRALLENEASPAAVAGASRTVGGRIFAVVCFSLAYLVAVATLLPAVHEALEFLVR